MEVMVGIQILVGSAAPAKIGPHGIAHEALPGILVSPEYLTGVQNRRSELVTIEVRERETTGRVP